MQIRNWIKDGSLEFTIRNMPACSITQVRLYPVTELYAVNDNANWIDNGHYRGAPDLPAYERLRLNALLEEHCQKRMESFRKANRRHKDTDEAQTYVI